jgi:hypothetical protein
MESSSACSCRLGAVIRALSLGRRPSPHKRQWQLFGALFLFLVSYAFYVSVTQNEKHLGYPALVIIGFFGIAVFAMAVLSAVVGLFGCGDCVSRM